MEKIKKIAVLFSGIGGNLENLLVKLHRQEHKGIKFEVTIAITNNPLALGLKVAQKYDVPTLVLDHRSFKSREDFDKELVKVIKSYEVDCVVMAGFMRILTPEFTAHVEAINLHPSLLPKYKGAKAIQQSFESVDLEAGVSVHYVNEALDAGDIIMQKSFQRDENETLESFTQKIKELEYEILPLAVIKCLTS